MGRYAPGSTPAQPQLLVTGGGRSERPRVDPKIAKQAAQFLVDVSLTNPDAKEYEFKPLPRPKGRATRVIITEYDLPRKNAFPHDVVIDPDGNAWYSDFGSQVMGVLDPKTGKVIDYDIPVVRAEQPKGTLDLQLDRDGNLWIAMMYQAAIAKMDRQTRKLTVYPYPKEWLGFSTQASMVAPRFSHVDGKVWSNNQETREYYRLNVATGKFENTGKAIDKNGKQISAYGIPTDQDNNMYLLEFGGTSIGRRDAKTLDVEIWRTPFANSKPRRGGVDHLNRLWFAEYHGGIAMFDPKTKTIKEWMTPTKWDNPYGVAAARNGEVWTGSMHTDLVTRLFPESGEWCNICYRATPTSAACSWRRADRGRCCGSAPTTAPRSCGSNRWIERIRQWRLLACPLPTRGEGTATRASGRELSQIENAPRELSNATNPGRQDPDCSSRRLWMRHSSVIASSI